MKNILLVLFLLIIMPAQAQHQVTGTVYDSKTKEPLPFVTVIIKGQKNRDYCYADGDGRYKIYVNPDDVLIFTYVGYNAWNEQVAGRRTIDVYLQEEVYNLGLYEGPIGHMTYHFFGMFATYTGEQWGYGFDYMYSPGRAFPQNTWHKILNELGFGIRATDIAPSDNLWTFYPYLNINPLNLFRDGKSWRDYNFPYPFVDVGYWFDTDFKSIGGHNVGFGGGFRYDIRRLFRIKGFPHLTVTAGYSAFAGQSSNYHFYIGLRIRPNVRPILIY